jgi:hypothetical protein
MMVFLHDASLYLLYAALGLAVYLAIERTIFTHTPVVKSKACWML